MQPHHLEFWQGRVRELTDAELAEKIGRDQLWIQDNTGKYPELTAFAQAQLPILLAEQAHRQS